MNNWGKDKQAEPAGVSAPVSSVRQYYERNTQLFLLSGWRKQTGSIHRAIWAPGVGDLETALNYANELVRSQLSKLAQQNPGEIVKVADLGCGVGGSLTYLASRLAGGFWGVGVTISPHQARMAQQLAQQLSLQGRCAFIEADYLALPLPGGVDAAYSIEAFAHTPDPQRYFCEASRILRAGGRLLLCDDFQGEQAEPDNFWLNSFQRGWQAMGVSSLSQAEELARRCGLHLVDQQDLTPHLRLSRLPDRLARWLVSAGLRSRDPYWRSVAGGIALQQALKAGIVTYLFIVFEKSA
jgi:cyclopropane fatty-acyl-phospholipid synthase-like methyltransferase